MLAFQRFYSAVSQSMREVPPTLKDSLRYHLSLLRG
jgi:hypothetical protein